VTPSNFFGAWYFCPAVSVSGINGLHFLDLDSGTFNEQYFQVFTL
jgi:hypothetical protein